MKDRMQGKMQGNIPGSWLVIMGGIHQGFDTPAKLCEGARGVHAHSLAYALRGLHEHRYIFRTERKAGLVKLELSQLGKQALGISVSVDPEEGQVDDEL